MNEVISLAAIGAALVAIVDVVRFYFPQLDAAKVKLMTVALSIFFGALYYFSQSNKMIEQLLTAILGVLGASQGIYALLISGTAIHTTLTNPGEEDVVPATDNVSIPQA